MSAASATGRDEGAALFRRLAWLTLFRLVMVTVLLGGTAVALWQAPEAMREAAEALFRLVLATYVVSLGFALVLRSRRLLLPLAYAHVALDVGTAGAVVALTGRGESVFVFMFLLAIVNGSLLLFRRGAVASTGLVLVAYLPLALTGSAPRAPGATLFVHGVAFLMTAALASYLSELLRRTGQQLEAREGDLAAITALHESIVQSVASGLVTVDGEGRITFLNRAGEQITGLALAQALGTPVARWFGPLERGRDEVDFVNARGERLRIGYTGSPLLRGGAAIGRAVVFQDLTQLRQMEARVQRSERLADLGKMAAGLAHELRNPLASMAGSVELLREATAPDGPERRLMDIVLREAERLNGLVTAFLEYARPAVPCRERVALELLVAETLEVFAQDPAAAHIQVESALEPTPAWGDAGQLRQVLWNLLSNAAHALAEAGGAGRIEVSCRPDRGGAVLSVEDDGPGVSPDEVTRLFTPFYTTRKDGTGLGLATVNRIVDAHDGTITVEPGVERGARFVVVLPPPPPGAALGAGGVADSRPRAKVA